MKSLDLKLVRDLWKTKGQVLAIALVLASGFAMCLMSLSTYQSLLRSRNEYYDSYRFADVFASLKRAPRDLSDKIAAIPGVKRVHTRVVADVTLDIEDFDDVAVGRMLSLDIPYHPNLNDPFLRKGRYPAVGAEDEILASEAFALAHDFDLGNTLTAIINGRKRDFRIVGTALSPEFIYSIKPGDLFPDDERFGVFWMNRKALEAAMGMEGAFNDIALSLEPGALLAEVLARLDEHLAPYGGVNAIGRQDQISHWFLENEFKQLKTMGYMIPLVFFLVAIFLLNMVLSRMIRTQRAQIAVLKAFGYGNDAVGLHYLKMVVVVVVLGAGFGTLAGGWLGANLTGLYGDFYKFPILTYRMDPEILLAALAFCGGVALLGTLVTVAEAFKLPPAEAMRPEPPARYRPTIPERLGLGGYLPTQLRMILRHLERQPLRSGLSVLGMALAVSVLVVGRFNADAIIHLMEVQFFVIQRQDMNVVFQEPQSHGALHELQALRGVSYVEPLRAVPVRLRNANHSRTTSIMGLVPGATLQRALDMDLKPIPLPEDGLLIGRKLAEVLDVEAGDMVALEVLEGRRPHRDVAVVALVDEYVGANVYMSLTGLNRLMGEEHAISGAYLEVDPLSQLQVFSWLKHAPKVAGVSTKRATLQSFYETMAENMNIMTFFIVLFSGIIAFGVAYNSGQMILSERSRDLATLRVIGFTRAEISGILLGELAVITVVSIPLGFVLGYGLSAMIVAGLQTELFRFPLIIERSTYGFATVTIMACALFSGLVVRRKLDRLDLMAVLKTRE